MAPCMTGQWPLCCNVYFQKDFTVNLSYTFHSVVVIVIFCYQVCCYCLQCPYICHQYCRQNVCSVADFVALLREVCLL